MASDRLGGAQLPLPLDPTPAYGREDFLVADCNREALGWIDAWPRWPGPLAVLAGPEGSGKTHLAHVWCRRSNARIVDVRTFDLDSIARAPIAVEDVDRAPDDARLLHVLNRAAEAGGYMLTLPRGWRRAIGAAGFPIWCPGCGRRPRWRSAVPTTG